MTTEPLYYESFDSLDDYWNNSIILQQIKEVDDNNFCHNCIYYPRCNPCKAWDEAIYREFSKGYSACPIFTEKSEGNK